MGTFAEFLKAQHERQDRVGWAARMWESAKIGRISSPTSIIRKMEEFAGDAQSEEDRNKWNLAALGAREAAEEYRRRPDEDDQHPAPPPLPPAVPLPFPNASSPGVTVSMPVSENAAVAMGPDAPPQPPEGGVPLAVFRPVSPPPAQAGTPAAAGKYTGWPQERFDRMERAIAEIAAVQASNNELLTVIAEFLVIKGDQEGLRAALGRALAGAGDRIEHPSLNWATMWASADHAAQEG